MNDKKCKCAILAHTNGYELTMEQFDTYEQAYDRMKSEYDNNMSSYYKDDIDKAASYIDEFSANLTATGIDILLWQIKLVK